MAGACRGVVLRASARRICASVTFNSPTSVAALAVPISSRGISSIVGAVVARGHPRPLQFSPKVCQFTWIRFFSSGDRTTGSVKMWNEEKGFGFICPSTGGEDVFCHKSALGNGVVVSSGTPVTYKASWDERKKKYRAEDVALGEQSSSGNQNERVDAPARTSHGEGSQAPTAVFIKPREHHIVGSFGGWATQKEPMASDGGKLRHRITIRSDAPQAKSDRQLKCEEFQILGDAKWEQRLYPAGGEKEEVVVLQPGGATSLATSGQGKGHGRNWAVQGRLGEAFDVLYDPESRVVSCESVFREAR